MISIEKKAGDVDKASAQKIHMNKAANGEKHGHPKSRRRKCHNVPVVALGRQTQVCPDRGWIAIKVIGDFMTHYNIHKCL